MGVQLSICVLCLGFVFVTGSRLQIADQIISYFHSRNIVLLNIFICEEKDNFLLRKADNFTNFLAVIYFNRAVKWDDIKKKNSGWFLDSSCQSNRKLFKSIPETMLGEGFFWLIRGVLEDFLATLKQTDLGLSTDLVLADDNGTYFEIYRLTSKSEIKVKQSQLSRFPSKRNRYNLEGHTLRGSLALNNLELNSVTRDLILDKYYRPQTEIMNRKNYVIFLHLSRLFNFKIDIVPSQSFGYKTSNGTFDGQIRDIIMKRVDFGISPMGFTHERLNVVDYTANLDQLKFLFIFMEKKSFGGFKALCQPFTSRVWAGVFIITVASIVATVLSQLPMNSHFSVVDGCMNLISILSSQGFSYEFPGHRTMFLSIVLLSFGMIISIFYHTSIMDGLLSPTPISIKTIQDVLDNKKIGLANIPYLTPIFFHPLVTKRIKETHSEIYEVQMGIKKLQEDKTFTLIGDELTMHVLLQDSLTNAEKCNEREMTMSTGIKLSHIIEKNSHYREMIIQGEFLLNERGIADRERKHWYPNSPKCLLSNSFVTVSVESIVIGLIIFSIGLISSVITVTIERIVVNKLSKTVTKHSKKKGIILTTCNTDKSEQNFMDNVDAAYIVLLHTFEYLNASDLLRASMVSKLWNFVSSHNMFWKTVKLDCKLIDYKVFAFAEKLQNHRTQVLDLEEMRFDCKPLEYLRPDPYWIELFEALKSVRTLTKINVGSCPVNMISLMADAAPQLRSIGLTCVGNGIDFNYIGKLTNLTELNVRYKNCNVSIMYIESLMLLKNLKVLSLRRLNGIDIAIKYLPSSLESLVLGASTTIPSMFPRNILPTLVNLKHLTVEECEDENIAIELVTAISALPNLKRVELINICVSEDFEHALAKCSNLKTLSIAPLYRNCFYSFIPHQIVINGASELRDTIDQFTLCLDIGCITYLANIVKNSMDRTIKNVNIRYFGEGLSIPFKREFCQCESYCCNLLVHIDMVTLSLIEDEMLPKCLPRTKVKIPKNSYYQ